MNPAPRMTDIPSLVYRMAAKDCDNPTMRAEQLCPGAHCILRSARQLALVSVLVKWAWTLLVLYAAYSSLSPHHKSLSQGRKRNESESRVKKSNLESRSIQSPENGTASLRFFVDIAASTNVVIASRICGGSRFQTSEMYSTEAPELPLVDFECLFESFGHC